MGKTKETKVVRNYKDTVFRMLFREKGNLLELYNALNKTSYSNPDELEVTTLDNAVYMNVKNDVSFIFRSYMMLYEHQSTYSPNIPLRDLIYISRQYEKYITDGSIYSSSAVAIPTPKFVVFYNGTKKLPEEMVLRLSDAYEVKEEEPDLELKVKVVNVNPGCNDSIIRSCRILKEYCEYVECVRKYAKDMPITEAMDYAINECIKKNILGDFLKKQKAEVVAVSIFEYDEEKLRKAEYDFGVKEGEKIGEKRGEKKGELYSIISLVCKKLKKQYTAARIADELEIPEETADKLCKIADKYSPEYDMEKICEEIEKNNINL